MRSATVAALTDGSAYADLSSWRKVGVSGPAALDWLNRIVTADVDGLAPGRARRSLLLTERGGIAASFTVAVPGSVLLVQDPDEPASLLDLLARYAGEADVAIDDRSDSIALFAFPGRARPPDIAGTVASAPSCLGEGSDVFALAHDREALAGQIGRTIRVAGTDELEAWRVATGMPRVGRDIGERDLPSEAGLAGLVDDKPSFVGRDALVRARPGRVLVRVHAEVWLQEGEPLLRGSEQVGALTSAAGVAGLAMIAAGALTAPLRTTAGATVRVEPVEAS